MQTLTGILMRFTAYNQLLSSPRMIETIKKFALIIFLFALVLCSLFFYGSARDAQAERAIVDYVPLLEDFRTREGAYPDSLEILELVIENEVWGLLPGSKIEYIREEGEFYLYYIQYPIGPGYVYSSSTKSWTFDEI